MKNNITYLPNIKDIKRKSYLIDANNKILGHIAAKAASILRGKHKAIFTPHLETGDTVIIINAAKVRVSGKKRTEKFYRSYTGYTSGLRFMSFEELMKRAPTKAIQLAVNRMIPKGALGNKIRTRLRVYAGDQHPHAGQEPISVEI